MPAKAKRTQAYLFLLLNTLVWGAFIPLVKLGFNDSSISPFRFLFYRFLLAGILMTPLIISYYRKLSQPLHKTGKILLLESLQTTIGLSLLYLGLAQTTALETNLISTSLPVLVIIGGIIFLREKQERHERLGLLLAMIGTLVITLEPLWLGQDHFNGSLLGNLLVLGYNLVNAAYLLLAKIHYRRLPKLFVAGISFYLGIVSFAILSYLEARQTGVSLLQLISIDLQSPLAWGVIAYAAIFGSIIGLTAYIKGQDGIEASEASLFNYLQPAIYIPLGYLLLGEQATLWQISALVVIIVGVGLASRRQERTK